MNYSLITEQQFQKRVYNLPSILKNALYSESVMGVIRHICQSHYFDDDKTLIVEQLTALVLSGFVALEDMSKEIAENLGVNKQLADSIYQEIDKKIFLSLKEEIKKVYSPLVVPKSNLSWGASKIGLKPATKEEDVVDLKTKPAAEISSETVEIKPKEISPEAVVLKKPEITSTQKVEVPNARVSEKEEPTIFGKVEPKISSITLEKSLGEEAPMILHKETELTPLAAEKKSLAEAFSFSSGKEPVVKKESSDLAAKISFGADAEKKKENKIQKIQIGKPNVRVVHYSDLNTPIFSFGKEQPSQPQVFSQSKEIDIGFEPKVIKMEEKTTSEISKKESEKPFFASAKTEISSPAGEEKDIQVPLVEKSSIKIDNGVKIDFEKSTNNESFKTSGLSIKEATERKAVEEAKKEPPKIEQKSSPKSVNEIQLKDIPVEEDIIDLREINK